MLNNRIRNAAAAARPVNASGVEAISDWPIAPVGEERSIEDLAVAGKRVVAGRLEHDPEQEEGEQQRRHRHDEEQPARLLEAALNPHVDRALRP